jgi:flagellar hook protein FlgE
MMRSMFSGVSGLRAHQTMMDVVGNNIANVNTAGFKASQVTFQEALSQTLRGAAGSSATTRGGTNPIQIGLGAIVASIDGIFTQGAAQVTGRNTDLTLQGDGFFVLSQGGGDRNYTRAGAFNFDEDGYLVNPDGLKVQGWMADALGNVDTNATIDAIKLPIGQVIDPITTTSVSVGGNLSSEAANGTTVSTTITVFDSEGASHLLKVDFTKTGTNAWSAAATLDGTTPVDLDTAGAGTTAAVTFSATGQLTSGDITTGAIAVTGANPIALTLDLGGDGPLVQFGGASTAAAFSQNGEAIGFLRSFAIGNDGAITGQFSNGATKQLAQVAVASFNNPTGLTRLGNSNFGASVNSGEALIGTAGTGNRGSLIAGAVEMSNVDLAREFTSMIIAQRGFQANSRIITTSDEMLNELVNLKR